MNREPEMIMYDSPEAAKEVTLTGWLSRDGRFFGKDEHMARWAGCTHLKCECGATRERNYTKCDECLHKAKVERYNAYKFEEWNGITPLHDLWTDTYFFSSDDIDDYIEEFKEQNDGELPVMMLVLCNANYMHTVDSSYWEDIAPEDWDGDLPKDMQAALNALNDVIKKQPALSWEPSNIRTNYSPIPNPI